MATMNECHSNKLAHVHGGDRFGCATSGKGSDLMHLAAVINRRSGQPSHAGCSLYPTVRDFYLSGVLCEKQ